MKKLEKSSYKRTRRTLYGSDSSLENLLKNDYFHIKNIRVIKKSPIETNCFSNDLYKIVISSSASKIFREIKSLKNTRYLDEFIKLLIFLENQPKG